MVSRLASSASKIGFWGNFGTRNWGNECTLQAIVHNVRARLPEAELCCFCFEPGDTERRHGLSAFPISQSRWATAERPAGSPFSPRRLLRRLFAELRDWSETFAVARLVDVVVMTGTGMLTDTSEGHFGLPYDMFKWALAVKISGRKLFFVSVGVEPIRGRIARLFILGALRLADYRSYRDEQSREHLRRIGFATGDDAVFPDLAFSLPNAPAAAPPPSAGVHKPRVAVGVFDYCGRGQGGGTEAAAYRAYLEKLGSFVLWLLREGHPVRIIIGDFLYDEPVRKDLKVWLEASGLARHAEHFEDRPAQSVEELLEQIRSVDLVVASRFHNVLLAVFSGKPVASISYNVKNDALVAEMGLSSYRQPIGELDVNRLIEQFTRLSENAARLRPVMLEKAASYRDQLASQYTLLFGSGAAARLEGDVTRGRAPDIVVAPVEVD
ncbi:MAG: polysaccharide pyruvyl transferase family protein [Myxococcota bacterium]|nr:polysaccharide pyruvyl transferase family protein [Myxococcota bacterium]